jgi:hypothetical protein
MAGKCGAVADLSVSSVGELADPAARKVTGAFLPQQIGAGRLGSFPPTNMAPTVSCYIVYGFWDSRVSQEVVFRPGMRGT